jgi:gliding motility-associated-like protein
VLSSVGENGCESRDTVKITVNQLPKIVASSDKDKIDCTDPLLHLYASGGISYKWAPFDILNNPSIANPVATLKDTTIFYVVGTDINGCTNTDSLTINLSNNKILFIPNAFSPNGDGLNDEFLPKYNCDLDYIVFSVYNRFGQRIFTTGNKFVGWKGLQDGKDADTGTYFWIITGKDNSGKVIRKGDVTLIR